MKRSWLNLAMTAGLLFVLTAVGASNLVLDGSDSAPGSGKSPMACAGPLVVSNPVKMGGHDNNRITYVKVTGDMSACIGQTMLVEVDLDDAGVAHAYAVHQFTDPVSTLTFDFDVDSGDFTDTMPTVEDGTLVPAGTSLDPIKVKDFGLVTLTIATTWG